MAESSLRSSSFELLAAADTDAESVLNRTEPFGVSADEMGWAGCDYSPPTTETNELLRRDELDALKGTLTGRIDRLEAENGELRAEIACLRRKGTLRGRITMEALERGDIIPLSSWKDDEQEWTADLQLDGAYLCTTLNVVGVAEGTTLRGAFNFAIHSNGKFLTEMPNEPLAVTRHSKHSVVYETPVAKFKDACKKFIREEADGAWVADFEVRIHVLGTIAVFSKEEDDASSSECSEPDQDLSSTESTKSLSETNRIGTLRCRLYASALKQGDIIQLSSWKDGGLEWTADVQLDGDYLHTTLTVLGIAERTKLHGAFNLRIRSNGVNLNEERNKRWALTSSKNTLAYDGYLFCDCTERSITKLMESRNPFVRDRNGAWVADLEVRIHVLSSNAVANKESYDAWQNQDEYEGRCCLS